jgi:hypothetical protein
VVRRYLRAYGPARLEDAAWWTGLPVADCRRVLDNLGREVVRLPVDGLGDGLVTLREVADQTRKGGSGVGVPDRILFLPLWDAYPLGWRDRTRVVEPRFAPWVYDASGNTTSVIVEEGRVIGLWQFRDGDNVTLEFHLFEPYANRSNAVRLAAETHAGQLAVVSGARDIRVIERALPAPLAERPAQSFLWPLGKEPVFRISETDDENPMDRRERQPNVLRSKFLDDERLVRPVDENARPEPARGGWNDKPLDAKPIVLGGQKPIVKAAQPKPELASAPIASAVVPPSPVKLPSVDAEPEEEDPTAAVTKRLAKAAQPKPSPMRADKKPAKPKH